MWIAGCLGSSGVARSLDQLRGLESPISQIGKSFDPKLHEVAVKVPTKEYAENVVIGEIRTGYIFRDKVIRPSMVKITTHLGVES